MRLADAALLAEKVLAVFEPFCERVAVAGSIRRGRSEVHDIDLVAIPKPVEMLGPLCGTAHFTESMVWEQLIPKALKKWGLKSEVSGQELLRFTFPLTGFQVDVYHARAETWGVILLVRTGSREHNVKLCSLAKGKGLMLSAAQGVVSNGQVVASRSEEEIFSALGLGFVEPKNREANW